MSTPKTGDPDFPTIDSKEYEETETLKEVVERITPIKEWLVNYVGSQHNPDDGEVTVEMVVETMAAEFPEFLLALAEENWIRGYRQGISDVDHGMKLAAEEEAKTTVKGKYDGSGACVAEVEEDQSGGENE